MFVFSYFSQAWNEWLFFVRILGISDLRGQRRINTPPPPTALKELGSKRPLQAPSTCPRQVAAHAGHHWGWQERAPIGHGSHGDFQLCGPPPCHLVQTTHCPVTWAKYNIVVSTWKDGSDKGMPGKCSAMMRVTTAVLRDHLPQEMGTLSLEPKEFKKNMPNQSHREREAALS